MPRTVLIVDESVSMRQLAAFSLKEAGYDVVSAIHGVEALKKLEERKFDIVLTDIDISGMSSIEFIRQLRGRSGYDATPIVMFTTGAEEPKNIEGREAGADGWIEKPFTPQQLVKVVREFTRR